MHKFLTGFILTILTIPLTTNACTPLQGDHWFNSQVIFDYSEFPEGLKVTSDSTSDWSDLESGFNERINRLGPFVTNEGDEPIYIVEDPEKVQSYIRSYKYPTVSPETPDHNAMYKVTNEMVYYWDKYKGEGWKVNHSNALEDNVYARSVSLGDVVNVLGVSSMVMADDRPEDVEIPEPTPLSIVFFVNGEVTRVTGHAVYSLNTDYRDGMHRAGVMACNTHHGVGTILIVGGLILVGAGFLIYKGGRFIYEKF